MIAALSLNLWTEVILDIHNNPDTNITCVYNRLGCTYAHVLNMLKILEQDKFVKLSRDGGASIYLSLTPTGKELAKHIQYIKNSISGGK